MRLSEAIMLGCSLNRQGFGDYEVRPVMSRVARTCAMGAALKAIGKDVDFLEEEVWPWIIGNAICPACGSEGEVARTIFHLNDDHEWSRERIADWVATIEPAETPEEKREIVENFCEQLAQSK